MLVHQRVLHVSFMFLIIEPEALDQVHLEKAQRSRVQGYTSTSSTLDSCDFKSGYQAEANSTTSDTTNAWTFGSDHGNPPCF